MVILLLLNLTAKPEIRGDEMNGFSNIEIMPKKTLKIQVHRTAGKIERAGVPLDY